MEDEGIKAKDDLSQFIDDLQSEKTIDEEEEEEETKTEETETKETKTEEEKPKEEEIKKEEKRVTFELPEKFKGKTPEEIAKAYIELETAHGKTTQEIGDLRKTVEILSGAAKTEETPPTKKETEKSEEEDQVPTVEELIKSVATKLYDNPAEALTELLQGVDKIYTSRQKKDFEGIKTTLQAVGNQVQLNMLYRFTSAYPDMVGKTQLIPIGTQILMSKLQAQGIDPKTKYMPNNVFDQDAYWKDLVTEIRVLLGTTETPKKEETTEQPKKKPSMKGPSGVKTETHRKEETTIGEEIEDMKGIL